MRLTEFIVIAVLFLLQLFVRGPLELKTRMTRLQGGEGLRHGVRLTNTRRTRIMAI